MSEPVTSPRSLTHNANVVTSDAGVTRNKNGRDHWFSPTREVTCEGCGEAMEVVQYGAGPTPRYHGAACRQKAYRARKATS